LSLLLVLNELSYRGVRAQPQELSDSLHRLVGLLRRVREHRTDVALVTEAKFIDLELGSGYTIRQWAGDGRNRDAFRYLMALRNRAPFRDVMPGELWREVDYRHADHPAAGLGTAHLSGGLAISLCLANVWQAAWLTLIQSALAEDDSGEIVLTDNEVQVRHASMPEHVAVHREWLCDSALDQIHSGAELWAAREDVFPHLRLLPRVADDLAKLRPGWLNPVKEQLAKLEQAAAGWNTALEAVPQWRSKVTPESDSRKELCRFRDVDGLDHIFEWHARITPGAGRLHFRLDRRAQRLVVAYIGPKLF
jgi:hypothetical protein